LRRITGNQTHDTGDVGLQVVLVSGDPLAGIEIVHLIRKGQMRSKEMLRPAEQFYSLAE
jgi:hypothetical protein